jgi:hypothetical protein
MSNATLTQAKAQRVAFDMATMQRVDAPDSGDDIVAGRTLADRGMRGDVSKSLTTLLLVLVSSLCLPSLAQSKEKRLTESQQVLNKVMEDIRHCDKTTPYGYDSKTKTISPPELKQIKGLKLKKLYREIAVFEINERYEGLHAKVLWIRRYGPSFNPPVSSVAFREPYKAVRERLEQSWKIQFKDGIRPGPDVIYDGLYAETVMLVDGKERTLSVAKMPLDAYPHIPMPDVGCNHFEY